MDEKNFVFVAERMRAERKRIGKTQAQIAEDGGVSERTYQDWERRLSPVNIEFLLRVAAQGIDIAYVLTGKREAELSPLTPEETALLDNYRNASAEGQAAARAVLNAVEKRPPRKKAGGE